MSHGNERRAIVRDDANRARRLAWPARREFGYPAVEVARVFGYRGTAG